ncbi:MAG: trimeric intracellular cation channel family protein [Armatimonadetes bacterium]|nr:trimeric intracellular cation channel family protein [Armatimonadota bacterium]
MVMHLLDILGIAVFAITGALAAGRKKMDAFGIVVVAIVTAVGGGTIRDLLLGIHPVLWIANPMYLTVATSAALATFMLVRFVRPPHRTLLVLDALGLATFTVIGCQKAMAAHVPHMVVVIMGVITGVAGGIIRDLLCHEIPLVLRREVYATASLLGSVVFVTLRYFHSQPTIAMVTAAVVTLVVRLFAIYWQISLPVFPDVQEEVEKQTLR